MIVWLPDIPATVTLPLFFPSYDGNGASVTLTGLAVTDIEIYKGTSMTQRSSDNGYALVDTDGIDIDSRTGIHGFSIDLNDNSDAGFYAAGSFYHVVVDAVTIDAQTVRFIFAFRIVAAEGVAGTPKADVAAWLGTAASTPTVAGVPNVNAKTWNDLTTVALPLIPTVAGRTLDVSAGGEAGVDWANVGSPTTTVGLSGTTVKTATDVETDTTDIQSRLPAALVGGRMDSSVGAMVANVITAAATAADYLAEINAECDAALSDAGVTTTVMGRIDAAVSTRASQASLDTLDDYVDTEVAAIKAKTDNLPSDPADQSAVEAAILAAWTTALTEAYAADGAAATPAQLLYMIWSALAEFAISGVTITAKKLDGTTTAMTFTLDDATNPTSRTRAA